MGLFEHVLLPVASEDDAEATATAVRPYLEASGGTALAIHVIEKAGGAPDKASVEQRERRAERMFETMRSALETANVDLRTEVTYGTDVVERVMDLAEERGVSAIVIVPREGSRWARLVTGDVAHRMITTTRIPVVVLPRPE